MTNVYNEPHKLPIKKRLFEIGLQTLEKEGYTIGRIRGAGSSVRRATKGNKNLTVTIRTSQTQWFAFPRTGNDKGWLSLDGADLVVVVAIDDSREMAMPFIFPGDIVRERFDKLYAARRAAGHSIPVKRGVWLSLFSGDKSDAPIYVGAGLGYEDKYQREKVPLGFTAGPAGSSDDDDEDDVAETLQSDSSDEGPLTIPEAKRRLALTFGVDPSAIKIIVEG